MTVSALTPHGSVLADEVILAVPPALAVDRIDFDPPLPADLREVAASTAVWTGDGVKAVATFDDPFWRAAGVSGSGMSYAGPFREFHDHSGSGGRPAALFAFAAASHVAHLDADAIDVALRDQLVRMFGCRLSCAVDAHRRLEPCTLHRAALPSRARFDEDFRCAGVPTAGSRARALGVHGDRNGVEAARSVLEEVEDPSMSRPRNTDRPRAANA